MDQSQEQQLIQRIYDLESRNDVLETQVDVLEKDFGFMKRDMADLMSLFKATQEHFYSLATAQHNLQKKINLWPFIKVPPQAT